MPHNESPPSTQKTRPRRRIATRVTLKPGAAPGTLIPMPGSLPATVTVLSKNESQQFVVRPIDNLATLPKPASKGVNWVRVTGLGNIEPLLAITEFYGISRLALEDTLSLGWRTKMEQQGEYAFFILQSSPDFIKHSKGDHLVLFCKPGLIISFEEAPTALLDTLWDRLQKELDTGRFSHLAELLTYMTLDMIVDGFFPHLDQKDETLAELEELISDHVPKREELNRLYQTKRDLITLRRRLTPFKELRSNLQKYHTPESFKELRPFFDDLNDHVIQADELLGTYYEVAKSLDEIAQSAISNRMNDIIRVLTIISTVFMPLSFIAGVYGMNFETSSPLNMPELSWSFGYPFALSLMAGTVAVMLWFFKKKNWL